MATFKEVMTGIADSIRTVKGTTAKIKIANIPSEINKMAYIDNGNVTGVVNKVTMDTPTITVNQDTGVINASISGKNGYINDTAKTASKNLTIQSSQTITPSTTDQNIPKGKYLTGNQTIKGDVNLKPENILRGLDPNGTTSNPTRLSIFGIEGTVDRIRPTMGYVGGSGYYGAQVADVAKSYHLARISGAASFQYNANSNIFNGKVTDSNGNCLVDCSSYAGLVLRGIPYDKSPFNNATGTANKTWSLSNLPTLCNNSEYVWADPWLDKQTDSSFRDVGISGYRSIRYASDIAEYFYTKGCILYEYTSDPTSVPTGLLPGDLLFWSKEGDSVTVKQKSRFKGISHVGIVAHDGVHYYQVTGSSTTKGDTVFYSNLANKNTDGVYDKLIYLRLILRPNYMPISKSPIYSPIGVNLMPKYKLAGTSGSNEEVIDTKNKLSGWKRFGVTFLQKMDGSITANGTPTGNISLYIYGHDTPILLSAGTYKLSGCPTLTGATGQQWGIGMKKLDAIGGNTSDIKTNGVWDSGSGDTFTLSSDTWCYAYIYISSNLGAISNKVFKPSLIRTA